MNKLALGTVQFGLPYGIANKHGQVSLSEAKAMLQLAAANHIDTLDTAIAYGESETCLGKIGIQGFKMVTKLPALPDNCSNVRRWVQEQVFASFSRLGVSAVYGLLLHRPEQLLGKNGKELYQALLGLKDDGLVQKVGVSIYAPNELEEVIKLFDIDLVQAPFNLVDQRMYTNGWLSRLKDIEVEIHTRSTFLQGLLLMPYEAIPPQFSIWIDLWEKWYNWLSVSNVSALNACLSYPLSFPEIDRVVIGAESSMQLKQIIHASGCGLPVDLPELQCEDENLVNPSFWSTK